MTGKYELEFDDLHENCQVIIVLHSYDIHSLNILGENFCY